VGEGEWAERWIAGLGGSAVELERGLAAVGAEMGVGMEEGVEETEGFVGEKLRLVAWGIETVGAGRAIYGWARQVVVVYLDWGRGRRTSRL
jgi:hypothetical protein